MITLGRHYLLSTKDYTCTDGITLGWQYLFIESPIIYIVQLSFFGNISLGRVGNPVVDDDSGLFVASLDDLMAKAPGMLLPLWSMMLAGELCYSILKGGRDSKYAYCLDMTLHRLRFNDWPYWPE